MKGLPSIFAAFSCAAGIAGAQPLDRPPTPEVPRIEIPGADPSAPPLTEPDAAEQLPPRSQARPEARIEQRRRGAKVAEIVVTPAGRSYSYTIENREGQRTLSPQDLASGLSTPRFLKFEF